MYNSDNNWTPPYYPPNPNPIDPHHHHHASPPPPPPSFASAPPYAPPPPPPQPPQSPSSYPPFPPNPDHVYPTTTPHGIYSSAPPPHQSSPAPLPSPYDPHQSPLTHPPYPNPNLGSYGYNNSSKFEYGSGYFDEGHGSGYGGYDGNDQRLNLGLGSGLELYGKRGDSERYEMGYGGGYNANNQRLNSGPGSGLESYGKRGESERYEMGYGGGYGGGNNSQRVNVGSESYGNKRGESERYEMGMYKDDGVYAYEGTKEPYGARGTDSKGSNWSGLFDDYGRPISFPATSEKKTTSPLKVVKAVPKVETDVDVKSGVQKFRVKLLPESGGSSVMDVLCMVGLDGIRMLDPSTSRTLRIYPLDTVTRCDKIDSSTFAFWSKTSVDVEARRIRLQSSSYTTNTILDTVTAAMVQFKEMGGSVRPAESFKAPEQPADKKKGFTEWITKLKPVNEEKDHWVPDEVVSKCTGCGSDFSAFNRRHHCRNCGDVFCDKCTQGRTPLNNDDSAPSVRVCDRCMGEVSRRLSKAKEVVSRPVALHSHEDLAKKLQEEMEKNLRISGSKSEGSGKQMREVACPTCTVHLQVQVPSSGSETIECGVCQHPFLVSAH